MYLLSKKRDNIKLPTFQKLSIQQQTWDHNISYAPKVKQQKQENL